MAPLVAAIIWLGVYPKPVLDRMQHSAEHFVSVVERGAATQTASIVNGMTVSNNVNPRKSLFVVKNS